MTIDAIQWCRQHPNYICDALTKEWFKIREAGRMVTGSRVGQLMGLDEWRSRDELLEEMRNPVSVESRHMLWGSAMEVPNMKVFASITGLKIAPVNAFFADGRVGATIDGIVLEPLLGPLADVEEGKRWVSAPTYWSHSMQQLHEARAKGGAKPWLVEMKQTGEKYKKHWSKKEHPQNYWAQVQAQLLVTGLDTALLVAKIGTADMRFVVIEADSFFQDDIRMEAQKLIEEI